MAVAMASTISIVGGFIGSGVKRAWVGGCKDINQRLKWWIKYENVLPTAEMEGGRHSYFRIR